MCPSDDSHLTIEYDDYYIISPSIDFYSRVEDFSINKLGEHGVFVEPGFEYNSSINKHFLNNDEILAFN
jgi:UDP-N-acetylglucosamine 4,6-dehydratase